MDRRRLEGQRVASGPRHQLQIYLFGLLEIRYGGQLLSKPATAKSQSLLAYLALHRHTKHNRERLINLLWKDQPENKARRSLSTAVWHIRRCLPDEDLILSEADTLQVDPEADLWVDVEEFLVYTKKGEAADLQSALALYRGEFLDGFYYEWVIDERYHLENIFAETLSRVMSLNIEKGSYHEALATALRLLELDPLREGAHRLSMLAYCRLGHRNKALAQYHRCRDLVRNELGIEPMPETTELYHSIMSGKFDFYEEAVLPPTPLSDSRLFIPSGRSPLDALPISRLVGRDQELAFLHGCWQAAKAGGGGIVLVSGEAGVGKTRLVDEFASSLRRQGHYVLWGRCYEFERFLPYQPFAGAFQTILSTMTNAELAELPVWVLRALAGLLPEALEKIPSLSDDTSQFTGETQKRLFEAVSRLLANLSFREAVLIVLEDLHWASKSTLHLLHHILRALVKQPILVIGTLRPESFIEQQLWQDLYEQLRRDGLVQSLSLARLTQEHVEQLLLEMSGAGEKVLPLAQKLFLETEGNPFFLIEIAKSLFDQGQIILEEGSWKGDFIHIAQGNLPLPTSISKAILARVRALDGESRYVLQLAAILGSAFDFNKLSAVLGRGDEPVLKALDDLLQRRLISEASLATEWDYIFPHHKIQEAVYASIPRLHRLHGHARVGEALEKLYGPQFKAAAGELAYHFERCRGLSEVANEKAISYLMMAGDYARTAYAFPEAIDCYQRALNILKEGREYERNARVLMKLGLTYHLALDFQRAHRTYEQSFSSWQRAMDIRPTRLPPAPHALKLVVFDEPFTLDPTIMGDFASRSIARQIFSGLVELTPELDILPDMARDWQVLEEGSKYVFHLRDDVFWSDGMPVSAEDFEYSWKQFLDPQINSPNQHLLRGIKGGAAFWQGMIGSDDVGIRALDPATFVIELEEPAGYFLQLISHLYPIPRHVIMKYGAAWTDEKHLVTNGPFRIESWRAGEMQTLVRNPDYHSRFKGNVERIELIYGLDPDIRMKMYKADVLDVLSLDDYPLLGESDLARQPYAADYTLMPAWRIRHIQFNTGIPPLNDLRVRQALALAIDGEQLADVIFKGFHSPAIGGLLPPGMPGHSPDMGLPYDPVRSRQLLAQAGYPDGNGFPTLHAYLLHTHSLLGDYLRDQWRTILGIEVPWQTVGWSDYININTTIGLKADMVIFGLFPTYPDPESLLGMEEVQRNTNWRHDSYEKLVEQARRMQDQKMRMRLYQDVERILIGEAVIIPLFYHWYPLLVKPWVENFKISPVLDWFWKDVIVKPH